MPSRDHRLPPGSQKSQWLECRRLFALPGIPGGAPPEHSGGAVPESHRSSLFAGWEQQFPTDHQSAWWSLSITASLSTKPTPSGHPAGFTTGEAQTVKICRSEASLPSSRSGRAWPRRRDGTVGAHGSSCPMRSPSCPREKTAEHVQAGSIPPPIAPMSPGASICPSGNQGAAATCNFRVTEWLDRPVAKKRSWITTSG
jgi:hypothetical protein